MGSSIGLYVAYHLEKYYRRRREVRIHPLFSFHPSSHHHKTPSRQISRLYRPLSASNSSLALDYDDENESGTQLLPLHNKPDTPPTALFPQNNNNKRGKARARSENLALADVWDEREELFGVGEADEDDDDESDSEERTAPAPPVPQETQNAPRDPKPAKSVRWAEEGA